ncbi:hypothetical protein ACFY5D_03760 [Paeniglutamicibacter sp. NPDC012692]|uniref:hypothetical protein n=1 Tax=Paeniglutamicibacter sp. NPDC012692 TaxID=3364388 RepID=UPI0036A6B422
MSDALAALVAAADRKAKIDRELEVAMAELNAAIKAAIADPAVPTAKIREVTGLSNARIYQINARD